MQTIWTQFNGKNYWRKQGYSLLDGATSTTRNLQVVKLKKRRRPFWRIKRAIRLNLVNKAACLSPKKLWSRFKNGYINMMLRLAGEVGMINGGGGGFEKRMILEGRQVQVKYKSRGDYESRLVLEIYKALSTSKGLSEVVA